MSPLTSTPSPSTLSRLARVGHVVALALLLASGCARDGRYELLTIDPVEASRIDAGRVLWLTGSGFPVGREVEVALEGVSHGPLGVRRRIDHTLRGRTTSPERIELTASDADVAALGGRGTFEGSIEVVVHGASLDGLAARVVGVLEGVHLDVVPSERRARARRDARRDGLDLAALLGLHLESEETIEGDQEADAPSEEDLARDESPREPEALLGVRITSLDPSGAASRLGLGALGLEPDTRIVSIDDMSVLAEDELRVDPRASRVVLTLATPRGRARSLAIDLDAAQGRRPDRTTRYDQLAILVLVGALLFGTWPWSRTPTRPARTVEARDDKPFAAVLTSALALLVVLALSTLAADAWLHGSIALWLAAALFFRASAALATRSRASDRPTPSRVAIAELVSILTRSLRLESVSALAGAVAAAVGVGVFVTARGSIESASLPLLGGPLASAAWMPMSWALVRVPFGPFALAALLASAASTSEGVAAPRTRTERILRGVDELGLAALASVFVRVAIADPSSTELASRATALVATVALYAALLRARATSGAASSAARGALLACAISIVATVGVAVAWLSLETGGAALPGSTGGAASFAGEQAVAEVVLVCVGLLVVRVATLGRERAPASAS